MTIFADLWASALVTRFMSEPLLSADPFEVKWWLPGAQQEFERLHPPIESLPWNAQDKLAFEGSQATFLTLRFAHIQDGLARAKLVAFGDSCAFLLRANSLVEFFPANQLADLSLAPVCLPSSRRVFSHSFHTGADVEYELSLGDCIILVTDAVGRYLFEEAQRRDGNMAAALGEISSLETESHWREFVTSKRDAGELADDDCTILQITLCGATENAVELGATHSISKEACDVRASSYLASRTNGMDAEAAMLWGDGTALIQADLQAPDDLDRCRAIADAIDELESILKGEEPHSELTRRQLESAWRRHQDRLIGSPSAAKVLRVLNHLGVDLDFESSDSTSESTTTPL